MLVESASNQSVTVNGKVWFTLNDEFYTNVEAEPSDYPQFNTGNGVLWVVMKIEGSGSGATILLLSEDGRKLLLTALDLENEIYNADNLLTHSPQRNRFFFRNVMGNPEFSVHN